MRPYLLAGRARKHGIAMPLDDGCNGFGDRAGVGTEDEIDMVPGEKILVDARRPLRVAAIVAGDDLHFAPEYAAALVDLSLPQVVRLVLQIADRLVGARETQGDANPQRRTRRFRRCAREAR